MTLYRAHQSVALTMPDTQSMLRSSKILLSSLKISPILSSTRSSPIQKYAEMSMEDDYGMIDGIINNGSKEQPEVKPKAPDFAALFEAARHVVQEEKPAPEPTKFCGKPQKPLADRL